MMEPIAIIFNPSAGRGKAGRKLRKVENLLNARGVNFDLFVTHSEAHLVETVVRIIPEYRVIVGAGGDTSLNLIAHEILRYGQGNVMGVLSLGSTNDLAREIGVLKLEHACDAIADGVTRALDVGRINTGNGDSPHTFLAQASLGLGVAVNRYVEDWMRKHRLVSKFHSPAQMTAGMAGVISSFKNRLIPMKLSLESNSGFRTIASPLLSFNNTSFFAARFKPSPWASPVDGKLDCCIFNTTTFAQFLFTALKINSQKHLIDNKVEVLQDSYFKINVSEPFEFQVDGEVIQANGQIEVSVEKNALEVLIHRDWCSDILRPVPVPQPHALEMAVMTNPVIHHDSPFTR